MKNSSTQNNIASTETLAAAADRELRGAWAKGQQRIRMADGPFVPRAFDENLVLHRRLAATACKAAMMEALSLGRCYDAERLHRDYTEQTAAADALQHALDAEKN